MAHKRHRDNAHQTAFIAGVSATLANDVLEFLRPLRGFF